MVLNNISVRDYFALKALPLVAKHILDKNNEDSPILARKSDDQVIKDIAKMSYGIADAMLEAKDKN